MSVASFVLACALDLMGRSATQLPPIILVDERPAEASAAAVAFVRRGERAIYLIASAPPFREAMTENRETQRCRHLERLRFLASVIAHEEWHLVNGPDEQGAYYAQLTELHRLGSGPGRPSYESVRRAMSATLERDAARQRAAQQMAKATPAGGAPTTAASASDRLWPRGASEVSRLSLPPR
jgi:hypothetical protein